MDVIKDEGLFTLDNGFRKYGHYHKDRIPVIITMKRKKEMWENKLSDWNINNPIILELEELAKHDKFPKNRGLRHEKVCCV